MVRSLSLIDTLVLVFPSSSDMVRDTIWMSLSVVSENDFGLSPGEIFTTLLMLLN